MRFIDRDIDYKLVERRLRFRADDYRLVPVYSFEVDEFRRHCLLKGLDDIGLTRGDIDVIAARVSR